MLDRIPGACAAVITRGPTAIREPDLGQGISPVLPQEILVQTSAEVIPRKDLVFGAVAVGVPIRIDAMGGHRSRPEVEIEPFVPLLEGSALSPHFFDDNANATIAAAHDSFDERCLGVMPLHLNTVRLARVVAKKIDLSSKFFDCVLPEPLKWREWFWNKTTDRGCD